MLYAWVSNGLSRNANLLWGIEREPEIFKNASHPSLHACIQCSINYISGYTFLATDLTLPRRKPLQSPFRPCIRTFLLHSILLLGRPLSFPLLPHLHLRRPASPPHHLNRDLNRQHSHNNNNQHQPPNRILAKMIRESVANVIRARRASVYTREEEVPCPPARDGDAKRGERDPG